jgi:hypothetical protein
MKALAIDCFSAARNVTSSVFRSTRSMLDFDVVIWDPSRAISQYELDRDYAEYRGLPALADDDSARIVADAGRVQQEFRDLLRSGRSLVVLIPPPQTCYVDTGKREYSGTGRGRQTTRVVNEFNALKALPFRLSTAASSGSQIQFRGNEPLATFWRATKDLVEYRAYLTEENGTGFLLVPGTDRIVGAHGRIDKGNVLLLPVLRSEKRSTEEQYVDAIRALVDALSRTEGDFRLPDWTDRVLVAGEQAALQGIADFERDLNELSKRVQQARSELSTLRQRKLLFAGSGPALENQVEAALTALGCTVERGAPGRTDFIVRWQERIAVVETKGVNSSAAEKHSAQLEKWSLNYFEEHEVHAKPILVVNTFMDKHLTERTGVDFPDQMLPFATARDHCLITGAQLFRLVETAAVQSARREEFAELIFTTVGRLVLPDDLADLAESPSEGEPQAKDLAS